MHLHEILLLLGAGGDEVGHLSLPHRQACRFCDRRLGRFPYLTCRRRLTKPPATGGTRPVFGYFPSGALFVIIR
jgi:hypothetical protein